MPGARFAAELPRVRLAHLPTPLENLERLSEALGGPRILVKRDDCTGLATGGNKARKLEFLVGAALAEGADTLVTQGGNQSNHCRQTAAAAARFGLECVLVLNRSWSAAFTGNRMLDELLGARIVEVDREQDRPPAVDRVARELRRDGRKPYLIPTGGSNGVGSVGYAEAFAELVDQAGAMGARPDAVFVSTGSGGTHAGLALGAKLLRSSVRIVGVGEGDPKPGLIESALTAARQAAALLRADVDLSETDFEVLDAYAREGYGVPNPGMIEAVRLVAETEGIILDPVYTGKAMAGLIDRVRKGEFTKGQTVVFIHTGGAAGLFAAADSFRQSDPSP